MRDNWLSNSQAKTKAENQAQAGFVAQFHKNPPKYCVDIDTLA